MPETGWVIETARNTYWDGHGADRVHFVADISKAVRFARFIDAEIVRCWALEKHSYALRSAEHVFGLDASELIATAHRAKEAGEKVLADAKIPPEQLREPVTI